MNLGFRAQTAWLIVAVAVVQGGQAHGQGPAFEDPTSPRGSHAFTARDARALHLTNASLPDWVYELPDGGCLTTFYFSLKAGYGWSEEERKEFGKRVFLRSEEKPSINYALRELKEGYGLLDEVIRIKHSGARDNARYSESLEERVLSMAKKEEGVHFFGLAVNGGYHSVFIVVGKSKTTGKWEIYWLGQNSRGEVDPVV